MIKQSSSSFKRKFWNTETKRYKVIWSRYTPAQNKYIYIYIYKINTNNKKKLGKNLNAEIRAKKSEHQRTVDRRDLWRFISFYFLSRLSNTSLCRPGKLICCLVLFIYIVIGFDPFDSKYIPQAMMAQSSWPLYKNWL